MAPRHHRLLLHRVSVGAAADAVSVTPGRRLGEQQPNNNRRLSQSRNGHCWGDRAPRLRRGGPSRPGVMGARPDMPGAGAAALPRSATRDGQTPSASAVRCRRRSVDRYSSLARSTAAASPSTPARARRTPGSAAPTRRTLGYGVELPDHERAAAVGLHDPDLETISRANAIDRDGRHQPTLRPRHTTFY